MIKRGATHVGIVLSFVIFVTFLVFLYTTLQPTIESDKDKEVLLDVLKETLVNEISGELTSAVIKITDEPDKTGGCISIPHVEGHSSENFIVKWVPDAITGELIISSILSGSNLRIDSSLFDDDPEKIKIYYSSETFNNPSFSCPDPEPKPSEIELVQTNTYIFKSKVGNLKSRYDTDSTTLKTDLDLPPGTEFGFSFEEDNGDIISSGETDVTASIFAEELIIQYVNETANINTGSLTLRVW